MLLGIYYGLRDLIVAVWDVVRGVKRRAYSYSALVMAPREDLWRWLREMDTTYNQSKMRILVTPIEGVEDGFTAQIFTSGKELGTVAYVSEWDDENYVNRSRYLPEHSSLQSTIGEDDLIVQRLEAVGDQVTRVHYTRELSHKNFSTRITAPMGLRTSAFLSRQQAAQETGRDIGVGAKTLRHLTLAGLALASFWLLFGLQWALLLMVIILLHELGHALAMVMIGVGVGSIQFVPFFGGMATPAKNYETEWQHGYVALMGPGFSLIPTMALIWYALSYESWLAAHAAVLFALINGLNLLPIMPLDGGVVLKSLLVSIYKPLGRVLSWTGTLIFGGLALYLKSWLLGLVFLFALLQSVQTSSLNIDQYRQPLGWIKASILLIGIVAVFGIYLAVFMVAKNVESEIEDNLIASGAHLKLTGSSSVFGPGGVRGGLMDRAKKDPGSCLPQERTKHLEEFLKTVPLNGSRGNLPVLLVLAHGAGGDDARIAENWIERNKARSLGTGKFFSALRIFGRTYGDLAELVQLVQSGSVRDLYNLIEQRTVGGGGLKSGVEMVTPLLLAAGRKQDVRALRRMVETRPTRGPRTYIWRYDLEASYPALSLRREMDAARLERRRGYFQQLKDGILTGQFTRVSRLLFDNSAARGRNYDRININLNRVTLSAQTGTIGSVPVYLKRATKLYCLKKNRSRYAYSLRPRILARGYVGGLITTGKLPVDRLRLIK